MSSRFLTAGGGLLPGFSRAGSAAPAFDPATVFGAGDTGAWVNLAQGSSVLNGSSVAAADGDAIATLTDLSGKGHNLTQSTAGSRPLYHSSGAVKYAGFDGVDDTMLSAAYTLSSPTTVMLAVRFPVLPSGPICTPIDSASQQFGWDGAHIMVNAGSTVALTTNPPTATWCVLTGEFGSSGSIQVDNNAAVTGNAGTNTGNGLALAKYLFGSAQQIDIAAVFQINRLLTGTEKANLKTYLGNLVGKVL